MKKHGLVLQRYTGRHTPRAHDGTVATIRSNVRWGSDALDTMVHCVERRLGDVRRAAQGAVVTDGEARDAGPRAATIAAITSGAHRGETKPEAEALKVRDSSYEKVQQGVAG